MKACESQSKSLMNKSSDTFHIFALNNKPTGMSRRSCRHEVAWHLSSESLHELLYGVWGGNKSDAVMSPPNGWNMRHS